MKSKDIKFIVDLIRDGEISDYESHDEILKLIIDDKIPGLLLEEAHIKAREDEDIREDRVQYVITANIMIKPKVWLEWMKTNKYI